MKKLYILFLLLIVLTLSFSSCSKDNNVNYTDVSEFKYEEQNGSIKITEFIGQSTEVYIPSEINNMKVTTIGISSFEGNDNIKSVVIPNTVNKIEASAFRHCTNLTYMEIPESVKEIAGEGLEEVPYITNQTDEFVIVGDKILIDYNGAVGSDVDLIIPDGIKYIGDISLDKDYEFDNIHLPSSVETIGSFAFCCDFNTININDNVKKICISAFESSNWIDNLKDEFVIVGDGILIKYNGDDRNIIVPENVKSVSCADENYVFKNASSITFQDGLKYINESIFDTSGSILNGQEQINGKLVSDDEKITDIYIPSSVEYISDYAIWGRKSHITIISEAGSEAERYANDNDISFKALK